jgi:hypothetical protein
MLVFSTLPGTHSVLDLASVAWMRLPFRSWPGIRLSSFLSDTSMLKVPA